MNDFIGHYPGVIDPKICKDVLGFIDTKQITPTDFKGGQSQVDYNFISYDIDLNDPELNAANKHFVKAAENALDDYFEKPGMFKDLVNRSNYRYVHSSIDMIEKMGGLPIHFDKEYDKDFISKRNFIIVIYLNEITSGGELVFPLQKRIISPKVGDLAIIPSFFTHPHYVNPSLFEDRYAYHLNYSTRLDNEFY